MRKFDPIALALTSDLQAMRANKNLMPYCPEKIASSVLYEAGWAPVPGKPSIRDGNLRRMGRGAHGR